MRGRGAAVRDAQTTAAALVLPHRVALAVVTVLEHAAVRALKVAVDVDIMIVIIREAFEVNL